MPEPEYYPEEYQQQPQQQYPQIPTDPYLAMAQEERIKNIIEQINPKAYW